MSRIVARLAALFRSRSLDRDLDSDIQDHLDLAVHDAVARGLSPEAARREALREFGGTALLREEHRDSRSVRWLENFARDFAKGAAGLVRDPLVSIVAVTVLALGIGANTAMFSLIDGVLLRPLPFPEPGQLVEIWESPQSASRNSVNTMDFLDWQRLNDAFEAIAAQAPVTVTLTGDGQPERWDGNRVSASYFSILRINASLGRTFLPSEDEPGSERVAVLSHAQWRGRFGADPAIIGRKLTLDGEPHRIIGVLPPGTFDRDKALYWTPLVFTPEQRTRDFHWLRVTGRLRPGVSIEQAQQRMSALDTRLSPESPAWKRNWGVTVRPFGEQLVGDQLRRVILIATGAVLLVLLIACANVANLLLARGASRVREFGVRAALGASRARIVTQLLTESFVLCLTGTVAGLALAHLLMGIVKSLMGDSLPFTTDLTLDHRVLAFAAVTAVLVTLGAGLFPAINLSLRGIALSMGQGSRGASRRGLEMRRTLVAAEVALSLMLVCGALLLFRTLANLQAVDTGVRESSIVTALVELPLHAYTTPAKANLFLDNVQDRLRRTAGIQSAAATTDPPMTEVREGMAMLAQAGNSGVNLRYKRISPEYFETLGLSLKAGRALTREDRAGTPLVVVVNEALADAVSKGFGVKDVVGLRVRMVTPHWINLSATLEPTQIVGISRNELTNDPREPNHPVAYIPFDQVASRRAYFVVRTAGDPFAALPALREAVHAFDPALALGDVRSFGQLRAEALAGATQPALLIGAFALIAILLAAIGLYGVLAHAVSQQRKEIGIRMALGARPRVVIAEVLKGAFVMTAAGLALGIAGFWALSRLLQGLLFGVSSFDPAAVAVAGFAVALTGLLAAVLPSWRASRVEPVGVLREEG